jgi:hypothetical protein
VQFTEKLKTEINHTYNIKANILGPTACAMAMQINLSEQWNKSKGHGHPSHGGAVIPPALQKESTEAMGPTFKPVLMFNGQELLDRLPAELKSSYARDFHASNAAFQSGRVAQTTKNRESRWENWCMYVQPLGVDPYLQTTPFGLRCRCLMGYAARFRSGYFGKGKQVQASTVTSAITAVGKKIAMDTNINPIKLIGSEQFIICIQELLDGYRIADPPTEKKLPIEADVPELLFELGYGPSGTTLGKDVGDLTLIAFYYLLRVGKYTVKGTRNESKRTVQFKLEDITFFSAERDGTITVSPSRCACGNAPQR